MRLSRVPELFDQRMPLECLLDDPALHARAAAVNQSHFPKAGAMRGRDVFVDHRRHVSRGERMEIQRALDRDVVRHVTQQQRMWR